ncbi:MAG: RagB/SusD family nutrient uptake outer membrane protein [Salinivirgaceae bacterium]
MRKIIYGGLFVPVFGLMLLSCEDFLELRPSSQSVAEEVEQTDTLVYHSASELEAALAGVYADFRNEYFELDYFVNGDAQSDDAYAGADNPANFQIDAYNIDATNSNVSRDWAYLYSTIGKANLVINNAEAVPDATLTEFDKKQIKAEASAIRAYIYFQLVQLWGDVPLQLKEVTTISAELLPEIYPLLFPPRKAKEEVYAQIIADLEFALPLVRTNAINKGYVTTGFVNALLAKVYATMEPKDWVKVEYYCDAVINGGYSLVPNFEDLWNNENENSSEAIFEINYEGTSSSGNWGASMFIGFDWKKFNIPSNDLVRAYDQENDVIRKAASIIFMDVSGKWSDSHWPQTTYPFIYKYRIYSSPSPQNYIFLRLADIILLKAEALNEQGNVSGAAALVNQIRKRVDLPDTPAETQDDMRLAIEKERRLELAFEGHRWFDLKRTGRAIEVINGVTDQDGILLGYQLNENRLLWPIPQAELDKNAKLIQNSGY